MSQNTSENALPCKQMTKQTLTAQLQTLLTEIESTDIWRSVLDNEGQLLASGAGCFEDGIHSKHQIDFKGKSVADLGSNLGHFSRRAARQGAQVVHGYDLDDRLSQAARLLTALRGIDNVHFHSCDILRDAPTDVADMALLIDVIGKNIVASGRLRGFIDALQRYGSKELILTVRPMYRIQKDLHSSVQALESLYGPHCTARGHFLVLRYVVRMLSPCWRPVRIDHSLKGLSKVPVRFVRKEHASVALCP